MRQGAAAIIASFVLCSACGADTVWTPLSGDEIDTALADRGLSYANASQKFFASGRTLYNSGHDSWGSWRVEGNTYCSQWPPSNGWACYQVARNADSTALKFIGDSGAETVGTYEK